jgi:MoaA/NifB/PqqE/SkfB family radical SAM enzyme
MSKLKLYNVAKQMARPRVLANGSLNMLAFASNKPSPGGPLAVAWEILNACDCRCVFCDTHTLHKRFGILSKDAMEAIALKLGKSGVGAVTISGGEPLLSHSFYDVVDILNQHKVEVLLSTNGGRLEKHAQKIVEAGIRTISISLDSIDPNEHDIIRQSSGLTQRIMRGIEAVRAIPNGDQVLIRLRCVITPKNYESLVDFVAKYDSLVDEICFQPLHNQEEGDLHRVQDKSILFQPEQQPSFEKALNRLFEAYPRFDSPYYRNMTSFLFAPETLKNSFTCVAPALGFKISANGSVSLCSDSNEVIGNLVTDDIKTIWNHPAIRGLRKDCLNRTRECLCWQQHMQANDQMPQGLLSLLARPSA